MPDRTITFGGDASEARYRLRDTDPATSGDFVIERLDSSGNVVDTIQSWDDVAEEWSVPAFVADVLNADTEFIDPANVSHTGELADAADVSSIQASGDVDHDATTNRTHSGDDISPSAVDANTVSASDSFTDASGTSHIGEIADISDLFSGSHTDLSNVRGDQHGLTKSSPTAYFANSISSASPITIFSKSAGNEVAVYTGSILGANLNEIIVTWGDGTTDSFGPNNRVRGETSGGDFFAAWNVPKLTDVRELSYDYEEFSSTGYLVYTNG